MLITVPPMIEKIYSHLFFSVTEKPVPDCYLREAERVVRQTRQYAACTRMRHSLKDLHGRPVSLFIAFKCYYYNLIFKFCQVIFLSKTAVKICISDIRFKIRLFGGRVSKEFFIVAVKCGVVRKAALHTRFDRLKTCSYGSFCKIQSL